MTKEPFPTVGPDALPEITEFCERALAQRFTSSELGKALFAADEQSLVRFSAGTGLVVTVRDGEAGFIRLIAVDREQRRKGHGTALLRTAESDLEGSRTVTVGADPPYFLFPGVPTSEPDLCYLLERHHYVREEINYNVVVDLTRLPGEQSEGEHPGPRERGSIDAWSLEHWPNWRREFLRAFDQSSLLVSLDDRGIACACAFDVNRAATLGPIASRPDLIGKGAGKGLLLGTLRHMRELGYERIEVLWVGPFVPYFRVGGRIGQLFMVYRKRL